MLDELFAGFANGIGSAPILNQWDQMTLASNLSQAAREQSEDNLALGQEMTAQRQQQQYGNAWDNYLRSIDAMQGTTFRSGDLAGLDAEILRAEQEGWQSMWG